MLQEDEPENSRAAASAARAKKRDHTGKELSRSSDHYDGRHNRATTPNNSDDDNDGRHQRTPTPNPFNDESGRTTPNSLDGDQTPPHLRRDPPITPPATRNYRDASKLKSLKKKYQIDRGNTTDTVKLTVVYIDLINSYFFTEPKIN